MKLDEMELAEEKVLEKLNAVSTAKRLANMVSHAFGLFLECR
jgi:ATP-dependent RNA helicase DDX49/DBP8